jgi:tRNA modification GTPase
MSGCAASAFAVLTPPGRGGIAVIRCIGPAAAAAVAQSFCLVRASRDRGVAGGPAPPASASSGVSTSELPPVGALVYGHIIDAEGRPLDEVILHRAGAEAFEINCHGGVAAVKAVCERLESLGLEAVDADRLLELEGATPIVRDARHMLREATTPWAARLVLDQLNGALGEALRGTCDALAAGRSAEAAAAIERLLERWRTAGRFVADPPRIVIAGRPNSGKSTLFNRLVGAERALTSPAPGTTRDYVEAAAALDGVPVVLVDTAGLRQAEEALERDGVARAEREAARASIVIYVIDVGAGPTPEDVATLRLLGDRAVAVMNKVGAAEAARDVKASAGRAGEPAAAIPISALTGDGVDGLRAAILDRLGYRAPALGVAVPFTAGQAETLRQARDALVGGNALDARRRLREILGA